MSSGTNQVSSYYSSSIQPRTETPAIWAPQLSSSPTILDLQPFSSSQVDEKSFKAIIASTPHPHHIVTGVPSSPTIASTDTSKCDEKSSPHRLTKRDSSKAMKMFCSGHSPQIFGSGENLHSIDNPQWVSQVVNEALNKDLPLEQHLASQEITSRVSKIGFLWLGATQKTRKLASSQLNQIFQYFPRLRVLSITDFDLHDLEFSYLKPTCLQALRICNCSGFGNAKLATLQQLPSKITSLFITNCSEINSQAFDTLKKMPLTKLVLRRIHITDETLAAVAKIETLRCLALSRCPEITPKGIEHLKASTIQKLRLYHYPIDDQFTSVLEKLPCTELSITKCAGLSSENMKRLHRSYSELKFSFSEFWDDFFFLPSNAIPPLARQHIEKIFFSAISENIPIPQWLEERMAKDSSQLTEIVIFAKQAPIARQTIESLKRCLPNIKTLKFQSGHFLDCEVPKVLALFPKLAHLSFESCTIPQGFGLLETVVRLQALTLINCDVDLDHVFHVPARLGFVELKEQTLSERSCQGLREVEELHLNQCKGLTKQNMMMLAKSLQLKKLTLMRPTNADDLLVPLKKMQSLRGLYIYLPTELTDTGMQTLAAVPGLEEFGINNYEEAISENGLKQFLESHKDLESLELNFHSSMHPPLDSIFKLPKLHTLSLGSFNKLTDASFQEISNHVSLRSLKLNNLSITGTGFSAFRMMETLERVELEWCRELTVDAYKNLAACKGLKYLKIQNARFMDDWRDFFPKEPQFKLEKLINPLV